MIMLSESLQLVNRVPRRTKAAVLHDHLITANLGLYNSIRRHSCVGCIQYDYSECSWSPTGCDSLPHDCLPLPHKLDPRTRATQVDAW